jgi:predicted dehydrogenase
MNVGIVGAGNMGSYHARIIKGIPGQRVLAIAGKGPARAAEVAKELDIAALGDWRAMLDDDGIDAIDVCAPTEAHAEVAIAAMNAGKHVIVEYPVCSTMRELTAMRAASARTGRACALAYYGRYHSQYRHLFELARSGSLGAISGLAISRRSSPVFRSSDIVNDLVAQDIDFMVRLLGKPRKIAAMRRDESSAVFEFLYPGLVATIEGSTDMHEGFPFSTYHRVSGTLGNAELTWRFGANGPESRLFMSDREGSSEPTVADYDPYERELREILASMDAGTADGTDGIGTVLDSAAVAFRCRSLARKAR